MSSLLMKIEPRGQVGSNKVKQLRKDNILPAVIYKKGDEPKAVQVSEMEFYRVYRVAGTTTVINLELEGKKHPVIVKEVQRHPYKNQILHVDFQELNMDETIKVSVPIVLLNRDNIRLQPSVLTQMLDEVEVECLPNNIPNAVEYDVADMTFDTPVHVKDLDIVNDKNITVLTELDSLVCTLSEPAREVEEEAVEGEEGLEAGEAEDTEETE